MHIQQILSVVNGSFLNSSIEDCSITYLLTDSRQLSFPKQTLFFALPGPRRDGHSFLQALYTAGLRNFIVSQQLDPSQFPNANLIWVPNSLTALQQLASHHRAQFDLPVIGITGSNGKTIVKEWLYQLLHDSMKVVRSPRSYNSQIGVPLSVWAIQKNDELGIFEAGISQVGEMEKIAPIIQCTIGLFTNIGSAHDEGFDSKEEKLQEKMRLFQSAHTLVYCLDQKEVALAMKGLEGKTHCCWSLENPAADLFVHAITESAGGTHLEARYEQQNLHIHIPFKDAASIENALHCWLLLLHLNFPAKLIEERMQHLVAVEMRLEQLAGSNHCTIINDGYNADLNALQMALSFVDQQSHHSKRSLILSDILQSGQSQNELYQHIARLLKERKIDRLIGIGTSIKSIHPFLASSIEAHFYQDTNHFLNQIDRHHFQNETILLKGARPFEFERIAHRLSLKAHQTVLEVNLSALLHNLKVYHQLLEARTKMMVMVKASAYGSGSFELAKLLESQPVDYLAVAYADEGIELRKAGIQLPILVLNPEAASFDAMIRYQLEPEIYSPELLKAFLRFLPSHHTVRIHLKLDSGMHRLGFEETDIPSLIDTLRQHPQLHIQSIFTHLAASEAAEHDHFTQTQIRLFEESYQSISEGIGYRPIRHVLNSSGIVRFPQYQMDMVRLGIGIYGVDSSGLLEEKLEPVLQLKARISQIKTVVGGETVGYGRSGKVSEPRRIATITIGYADGLLRLAGNGRFSVQLHQQSAPTVGNICMDMSMIDVSHIPEARQGDEVLLFGRQQSVKLLAKALNTIPYEVFTNISGRVKRVYFQD